jgi:hypothetical protein
MSEEIFPWGDVDAARNDAELQSKHDAEAARQEYGHGVKCSNCSRSAEKLAWFYFSSPAWTREHSCGRAGWMAVCDACRQQVTFACQLINWFSHRRLPEVSDRTVCRSQLRFGLAGVIWPCCPFPGVGANSSTRQSIVR